MKIAAFVKSKLVWRNILSGLFPTVRQWKSVMLAVISLEWVIYRRRAGVFLRDLPRKIRCDRNTPTVRNYRYLVWDKKISFSEISAKGIWSTKKCHELLHVGQQSVFLSCVDLLFRGDLRLFCAYLQFRVKVVLEVILFNNLLRAVRKSSNLSAGFWGGTCMTTSLRFTHPLSGYTKKK